VARYFFQAATGTDQDAYILDRASGGWWNGTALEAFDGGNFATYAVAAAEYGSTGVFWFTVPAGLPTGQYSVGTKTRLTASPLESDPNGAGGSIDWRGSAVVGVADLNDVSSQDVYDGAQTAVTDSAAAIAAAWGARVIGTHPDDGEITADMLLAGWFPDFTQSADGLTFTLSTIAGSGTLVGKTFTRLANTVGGVRSGT
jgi:hypothetical protein